VIADCLHSGVGLEGRHRTAGYSSEGGLLA
jgi:hypothetical protein